MRKKFKRPAQELVGEEYSGGRDIGNGKQELVRGKIVSVLRYGDRMSRATLDNGETVDVTPFVE